MKQNLVEIFSIVSTVIVFVSSWSLFIAYILTEPFPSSLSSYGWVFVLFVLETTYATIRRLQKLRKGEGISYHKSYNDSDKYEIEVT